MQLLALYWGIPYIANTNYGFINFYSPNALNMINNKNIDVRMKSSNKDTALFEKLFFS